MNSTRTHRPKSLSLLTMASLSFAIAFSVTVSSGQSGSLLAQSAKIPAPESCIKLLEDIMQRLHNMPTLAMKSAEKQQIAYQAANDSLTSQGPTNQLLAIKPKENSFYGFVNGRSDSPGTKDTRFATSKKTFASSIAAGATAPMRAAESVGQAGSSNSNQSDGLVYEENTRARAVGGAAGAKHPDLGKSLANLRGALTVYSVAQRSGSSGANKSGATDTFADAAAGQWANNTVMKSTVVHGAGAFSTGATNTAYGTNARYFNGRPAQLSTSIQGVAVTNVASNVASKSLPKEFMNSNSQSEKPGVTEWSHSGPTPFVAQGFAAKNRSAQAAEDENEQNADGVINPPLDPDSYKHNRVPFDPTKFPPAPAQPLLIRSHLASHKSKAEIAFSAPNLISGIPLVHLGSSAADAGAALKSLGKIDKHNVNSWTVWVLKKTNANEPAMQLYIRHGLVEAMRIFDSSLVASDFGVKLGDQLVDVKKQFGEPAFMIAEPDSVRQPAQNYVYPISQVSFELSRINKERLPKVVSILIFMVK